MRTVLTVALGLAASVAQAQQPRPIPLNPGTNMDANTIKLARTIGGAIVQDLTHFREFAQRGRICTASETKPADGGPGVDTLLEFCGEGPQRTAALITERPATGGRTRFAIEDLFQPLRLEPVQPNGRLPGAVRPVNFNATALGVANTLAQASLKAVGDLVDLLVLGNVCGGNVQTLTSTTTTSVTVCNQTSQGTEMHFAEIKVVKDNSPARNDQVMVSDPQKIQAAARPAQRPAPRR